MAMAVDDSEDETMKDANSEIIICKSGSDHPFVDSHPTPGE